MNINNWLEDCFLSEIAAANTEGNFKRGVKSYWKRVVTSNTNWCSQKIWFHFHPFPLWTFEVSPLLTFTPAYRAVSLPLCHSVTACIPLKTLSHHLEQGRQPTLEFIYLKNYFTWDAAVDLRPSDMALLHGDRTSPWPPSCAPVPGVEGGPRQVHWRCGAHRATALARPCLRQPGTVSWSFIFENKQNKNNFCHTLSNAIYTHIHSFKNIREYKHICIQKSILWQEQKR